MPAVRPEDGEEGGAGPDGDDHEGGHAVPGGNSINFLASKLFSLTWRNVPKPAPVEKLARSRNASRQLPA